MLTITKKMLSDLKKIKEDDLVVCEDCGSENVSEKMWVDSNSFISIDGETYYKHDNSVDDTMYWCNKCYEEAAPVHISEYKGDENAEQKS